MKINKIYKEDCLKGMTRIPEGSVDMILCDLPYGSLEVAWDKRLPFEPLWEQYKRITKENAAIVLFGNNKFEFELVNSAFNLFKYKWVWVKNNASNFINCKNRPMTRHEDILIFSKGTAANRASKNMTYNPQGLQVCGKIYKNGKRKFGTIAGVRPCNANYKEYERKYSNYPSNILFSILSLEQRDGIQAKNRLTYWNI